MTDAHKMIADQLLAAGLRPATPTRPGWSVQDGHNGAVAAVFWGIAAGDGHIGRPARIAGLGAVVDALTGRWNLTLDGRHWADGAPFCVLVYPHQPLRDTADATRYADPKAVLR